MDTRPGKITSVSITQPSFPTFILAAQKIWQEKGSDCTYETEILPVFGIQSQSLHFEDETYDSTTTMREQETFLDFIIFTEHELISWSDAISLWYGDSAWNVVVLPSSLSSSESHKIMNDMAQELIAILKDKTIKHIIERSGRVQVGKSSWIPERTEQLQDEPAKAVT